MTTLIADCRITQPAPQSEILTRIFAGAPALKAANDPATERPSLLVRRRERQRRRDAR